MHNGKLLFHRLKLQTVRSPLNIPGGLIRMEIPFVLNSDSKLTSHELHAKLWVTFVECLQRKHWPAGGNYALTTAWIEASMEDIAIITITNVTVKEWQFYTDMLLRQEKD
jgi:hypothetical protein